MQDIIIRGLCKSFGEKAVLCNVSGTLAAGRITGLMAPSGAGKTTLLRILMGLERADSGRIDGLNGLCIIAALGVSLNVTSSFLYPIVVAVSVITTVVWKNFRTWD